MGRLLGYRGPKANVAVQIRRLERDARQIPPSVEKLALMYDTSGFPRSGKKFADGGCKANRGKRLRAEWLWDQM